jgi:signal transduction histidine kinase
MIRKDEFGQLANEFNGMVKRLAKVHEFLAEQSYHLGIAEMARGVLHNIGNAVTPLGVKLDTLKGELVKAPVQEIEMAAAELDNPSTPSDRRADLQNFLELAGIGLSDTVKSTTQGIYDALRHVNHIQRILVDQHRLSKAQGVVEKLEMSKLLSDAVRLVPEKILKSVDIKLDPNISQVCEIYSNRIVVEQVISNMIINAYESINENSQRSARGTINIHAFQHPEEGLPVMHLCIEDNGTGISEENIKKLFIYGFSTKNRGSGMGLHWCSNAIVALKGRIYAESKGADQGAVFHLLLPCGDEVTLKKELSNEH